MVIRRDGLTKYLFLNSDFVNWTFLLVSTKGGGLSVHWFSAAFRTIERFSKFYHILTKLPCLKACTRYSYPWKFRGSLPFKFSCQPVKTTSGFKHNVQVIRQMTRRSIYEWFFLVNSSCIIFMTWLSWCLTYSLSSLNRVILHSHLHS